MHGENQLVNKMKSISKVGCPDLPDTVGGVDGEENITELFKKSYEALFTSAPTGYETELVRDRLKQLIDISAMDEINKVDANSVKYAAHKLKHGKCDVSNGFMSDALKNAPDFLYHQLAVSFRSWLYHGTVPLSLLACSFLPLLKSSSLTSYPFYCIFD